MFRTSIVFLILASSIGQAAKNCEPFILAYNEYTQKVEGVLVKKYSAFEMTDWSRNSRFQGFVLTDKAPQGVEVILETGSKKKPFLTKTSKTKPFSLNDKLRVVDLDVEKLLGSNPTSESSFIIRVLSSGKELCAEKKQITNDGD